MLIGPTGSASPKPSTRPQRIAQLLANAVCQLVCRYVSASYGGHEESLHPRSGKPDATLALDGGGDALCDVAKAHVVEPVQVDVVLTESSYRRTAVRVLVGLAIGRKVLLRDPHQVQSVDAVSGGSHGQRNTFHLGRGRVAAPPEGKRVPAGAKVRGHGVRGDFTRGQLGLPQPLGPGDPTSQKQRSGLQIFGDFADVLGKPPLGLAMGEQHVDHIGVAPRLGRLHRSISEFHIGVRERTAYHG